MEIVGAKNPWQDAVRQRSHGFEQGADSVREVESECGLGERGGVAVTSGGVAVDSRSKGIKSE